jgi:hypothetical protein
MPNRNVVFKHSNPSGASVRKPSAALTAALRHLAEADEMKSLVTDAQVQGRKVVVQVFHSSAGHPILIHLAAVPMDAI